MNAAKAETRRRHALAAFREELTKLDPEEIRDRLASNRIRSPERRAIAEELLRSLGAAAAPSEPAPTAESPATEAAASPEAAPVARRLGKAFGVGAVLAAIALAVRWIVRR